MRFVQIEQFRGVKDGTPVGNKREVKLNLGLVGGYGPSVLGTHLLYHLGQRKDCCAIWCPRCGAGLVTRRRDFGWMARRVSGVMFVRMVNTPACEAKPI